MKKGNIKKILFILLDILMIFLSCLLSFFILGDNLFEHKNILYIYLPTETLIIILIYAMLNLYRSSLRYASVIEIIKITITVIILTIGNLIFTLLFKKTYFNISLTIVNSMFIFMSTCFTRCIYRIVRYMSKNGLNFKKLDDSKRVMIIGAGDAGSMIIKELITSNKVNKKPICIIDDDPLKLKSYIYGVEVVGNRKDIPEMIKKYEIDEVIVAIPSSTSKDRSDILNICKETNVKVSILPGIYELVNGTVSVSKIRDVEITDLLGREQIKVNLNEIMGYIEGQVVLVTGGGGSIGSELCRQIATHNPKQLIILDIYENNAYDIEQELKRKLPNLNLLTLIASVRDNGKIEDIFNKYHPNIVFNAAAHKHVPLMETSPNEAIKNNVFGTLNVAKACDKYGTKRMIQISTDKAVNPTNIMGASKRICEMIIQTIGRHSSTCEFVAVRFGNVLGSNGSVIPLFKKQMAEGGPVTVTHKDIIRYFMTIPEAVSLVLQAGAYAKGGEIYVLDMGEPVRIYDLAYNLIKLSGYIPNVNMEIKITGLRPGEKLYEERLMAEEGLEKTANGLISIAKPIDLDEENLFKNLDELYTAAYDEVSNMKELVEKLVPTYKITDNK